MVQGISEEGQNLEGITHRGRHRRQGRRKGEEKTGEEAEETGLWHEASGFKKYLGGRSRA